MVEAAEEAETVTPRSDLQSEGFLRRKRAASVRYLRQLIDSVDFWVIITHRNAGHVRLWSAERCHVAFKLPPLSCSPANRVGAKYFCPSTLQTSCLCDIIPAKVCTSCRDVQSLQDTQQSNYLQRELRRCRIWREKLKLRISRGPCNQQHNNS